jgi:hypothetical protein
MIFKKHSGNKHILEHIFLERFFLALPSETEERKNKLSEHVQSEGGNELERRNIK